MGIRHKIVINCKNLFFLLLQTQFACNFHSIVVECIMLKACDLSIKSGIHNYCNILQITRYLQPSAIVPKCRSAWCILVWIRQTLREKRDYVGKILKPAGGRFHPRGGIPFSHYFLKFVPKITFLRHSSSSTCTLSSSGPGILNSHNSRLTENPKISNLYFPLQLCPFLNVSAVKI